METILQLLKENILQRKHNITEFLKNASAQTVSIRVGPVGEKAAEKQLQQLDTLLKKADDQTLGHCEICHDLVDENRLEMDYSSSVCLEHLSVEERTRLERDMELSQKVQQALLPHTTPDIRGLDVAAFSQPAHIVGGDYFDFLKPAGFTPNSHTGKRRSCACYLAAEWIVLPEYPVDKICNLLPRTVCRIDAHPDVLQRRT